ncbi:MAG: G5 domain-containing protein [Parcubacteria group bacterium]|jgi:uncharacterized protein YabE (DUF348 family)
MKKIVISLLLLFIGYFAFNFFHGSPRILDFNSPKNITFIDNGFIFNTPTSAATVDDFLGEQKISLSEHDQLIPTKNTVLFPGTTIAIKRALHVSVAADGQEEDLWTLTNDVRGAIIDSQISLGEDDLIKPSLASPLQKDLKISITRVEIKEEVVPKPIDFKTIAEEDDSLGWRIKKIKQKGIKGIKEIKYKVVSHDGKEISRKVLAENITQEPTPELVVQGTYMKLGKSAKGDASYYASSWGELNASRSIPRGGFAKVTNLDNGQSTIIKINDYGPQSPQRIIDLSYVSFSKIGDLGQGILHNVKVEQVLN